MVSAVATVRLRRTTAPKQTASSRDLQMVAGIDAYIATMTKLRDRIAARIPILIVRESSVPRH